MRYLTYLGIILLELALRGLGFISHYDRWNGKWERLKIQSRVQNTRSDIHKHELIVHLIPRVLDQAWSWELHSWLIKEVLLLYQRCCSQIHTNTSRYLIFCSFTNLNELSAPHLLTYNLSPLRPMWHTCVLLLVTDTWGRIWSWSCQCGRQDFSANILVEDFSFSVNWSALIDFFDWALSGCGYVRSPQSPLL